MAHELHERSPGRVLSEALDRSLEGGEIGLICAGAGIGKSALLVHFALEALLADQRVLHVSLREGVDHVRSYYDELVGSVADLSASAGRDRHALLVAVERNRMIHSYLDKKFDVDHLRDNLDMLAQVAQFEPRMLVLDGLVDAELEDVLPAVLRLAEKRDIPVWATVRTHVDGPDVRALPGVRVALELRAVDEAVTIGLMEADGLRALPMRLDPVTLLVVDEDHGKAPVAKTRLKAADCTLFSGGAAGAESAFGEEAERWGVHEVNFTFDGHNQSRTRGRYLLSPRELAAGDVSLVYVSRRLNRTYSEGSLIRKILQTLWHMVSRSQQVFIVGTIQEDGTVVGGTGWSVELARMWNKTLWVFDQEKNAWFHWNGEDWIKGVPTIDNIHFTGAGTRYLSESGRQAIAQLFERSFA